MSEFEKEMRKALIDRDLTIKDLSKELGISQAYLYDILKGNRPGAKHKEKIAKMFNLKIA